MPYNVDIDTMKYNLEVLDTIGEVTISRSTVDENNGYTWSVTFLTELGNVDSIIFDDASMVGTVVTGTVAETVQGIAPQFNSLDQSSGLPLGSVVITDLTTLSATVSSLDEGIAYYFRVSAINSIGQGPYAYAPTPYAIPAMQRPSVPVTPTLAVIDGTSLDVQFNPPQLDGGQDVTFYRVEYATSAFTPEVQKIKAACTIVEEVQVISTSTDNTIPEQQIIYISTGYSGSSTIEVQDVVCDATGGSFRLSFNGITSSSISYDADAATVEATLEALENINDVTVTFQNSITTACFSRNTYPTGYFSVQFNSVVNMAGNLPKMTSTTSNLLGLRYVAITTTTVGDEAIGGTFRLSFRGAITEAITAGTTSTVTDIDTALEQLSTIPTGGVTVTEDTSLSNRPTYHAMYIVTFTHADLGGDIDAITVVDTYNLLTGTDIAIGVYTDGATVTDLSSGGGSATIGTSVMGNQVGGAFTLTYRGHTTDDIDYNSADTVLKSRLEALPNVGTVTVVRTGPTVYKEYDWTVTFNSMPGAYPYGTGDNDQLIPAYSDLTGTSSTASVATSTDGSIPLGGTFALTYAYTDPATSFTTTNTTTAINADATAAEVEEAINALMNTGTVTVTRTDEADGYSWLVTFDGCKIVAGIDMCNHGNVALMTPVNSDSTLGVAMDDCASGDEVAVTLVTDGSGPDTCSSTATTLCEDYVTDLSGAAPYSYQITSLTAGTAYYVRVSAHNSEGYGYPEITSPEYETPTYNPPGAPPAVRLVSSTSTSITVEWDFPRENGGATVMGFELWMDDWAGGNPRLVFDGTDQPTVTEFTVSTSTSLVVSSGQSYRFLVRAINYCVASDANAACYSDYSTPAVFAVRSPRAPLAPAMPYRSSYSTIGVDAMDYTDDTLTIRWFPPIDNGGDPITKYYLSYAAPGASYTTVDVSFPVVYNSDQLFEHTLTGLTTGSVYRIYIVAENSIGKSAGSPILSVVVGMLPGLDKDRLNTYADVSPVVQAISADAITLAWNRPGTYSTGGIPITGYKVYMYPGVGLNTLANPTTVYNEVQVITTSVDAQTDEVQEGTILSLGTSTYFAISIYGYTGAYTLTYASPASAVDTYIEALLTSAGWTAPSVTSTITCGSSGCDSEMVVSVTFDYDGDVDDLIFSPDTTATAAGATASTTTVTQGTEVIDGTFTLSYNGTATVDMPFNVTSTEMKSCLDDLPGVGTVTVSRSDNGAPHRNAYVWTVTFDATAGNLDLLYPTAGRLTPLASNVAIAVTQQTAGSDVLLIYDGTGVSDVRTTTVTGLVSDMTYAFKVAPINALGPISINLFLN
jgi:hypothetical protein